MQLYEIVLSSIHFGFLKINITSQENKIAIVNLEQIFIILSYCTKLQAFFGSYLYLDKIVHIFRLATNVPEVC